MLDHSRERRDTRRDLLVERDLKRKRWRTVMKRLVNSRHSSFLRNILLLLLYWGTGEYVDSHRV